MVHEQADERIFQSLNGGNVVEYEPNEVQHTLSIHFSCQTFHLYDSKQGKQNY